jgi:DNA-binding response OmpR family regulator
MRSAEASVPQVDVLIAEDDAHLRARMRRVLEQEGFVCAEAEDGGKAMDLAEKAPPRCILLDLGIPGLDGFAVARHIRSNPRTRATRLHFLTGRAALAARQKAHRPGADPASAKPLDVSTLTALVQRILTPATAGVSGLTKTEAEDLLDWLEVNGFPIGEVSYRPWEGFSVRCPSA